jgi:phosphatidylserine/phosphatidylglycerophosphate/cardiolipin synthase-like enzyme
MISRCSSWLVGCAILAMHFGCTGDAPTTAEYRHRFEVVVQPAGDASLVDAAVRAVNRAERTAWVAVDAFDSERLVAALEAAAARGVDVRLVGDADRRSQPSFVRLEGSLPQVLDAQTLVSAIQYGNGSFAYAPSPDVAVERTGDDSQMTSNFVVVDELYVVGATDGFIESDSAAQIGFEAASEWLGRDFADEFRQMHAGVFATTLSAFNGPLKSDTNNRQFYRTDDGRIEVYFGPQERLMKQIIDEVYAARASVTVVADYLASAPLADALRYKAEAGFEVRVVVSERNRDVVSSRFEALREAFEGLDNASIVAAADRDGRAPFALDAVLIDDVRSPIDGRLHPAQAWVSTQTMVADISFIEVSEGVTQARASDAFSDAYVFVVDRSVYAPASPLYDQVAAAMDRAVEEAQ